MSPNNLLFYARESRLLEDSERNFNENVSYYRFHFLNPVFKYAFPHSPEFTVPGRDTRALSSSIYVGNIKLVGYPT